MRKLGVLIVFVLSLAGHAFADDARQAPIRDLQSRLIDAYNSGDTRGAAALFVTDGDLIAGDGTRVRDTAAIEHFLSDLYAKLPKGTHFVVTTVTDVRFPRPDMAVLTSEGGWLYPGETAISDKNQGVQSLICLEQKGTWRVVTFQRTRRPPPAAK